MTPLGDKALACLRAVDALRSASDWETGYARWLAAYEAACARFSTRAVDRKFAELVDRGYLLPLGNARTGWLTDKGRAALRDSA